MSHVELYRETVPLDPAGHQWGPGKWRWRFVADNGRVMADSGQGYSRRIDCLQGCATVLGGQPASDHITRHAWRGGFQTIEVRDLTKAGAS